MKKTITINNEFRVEHGLTPNQYMVALCVLDGIEYKHIRHELNITSHQVETAISALFKCNFIKYSDEEKLVVTKIFYDGHGTN